MYKLFLRLALISVAFVPATSVLAADLDEMVPPPPPPVAELRAATYDWTGGYVGVWAGATCVDGSLHDNTAVAPIIADWENDGCGSKGGLMAGYLHQFDSFVIGAELDWGMTGKVAENNTPGADFQFGMNHLVTSRLRAGYAVDDSLLYVTGGFAWAQGDLHGINGAVAPDHIKGSHKGWSIGGGFEHAFTDQFRMRLEYLYTRFGGANYYSAGGTCGVACDIDVDGFDDHEIKVGAIWAF
jgi:outer membrane immunogenic protein